MSGGHQLHVVGPLRIAGNDVVVHTNCEHFARAATNVFADLAQSPNAAPVERTVVFETIRHSEQQLQWSVHRNGEPCELRLRHDAVLVHQQWEFNRLAIESHRCSIHAAAVSVGGRGVLLAGASHSGKTTLAGWLVAHHGAAYVTDEVSAIDDRLQVLPFPRPLGVRSDSPLAVADSDEEGGFMPNERLVPISHLGGTRVDEPVPVGLLVFPRFDPKVSPAASKLSEAEALVRLTALTPGLAQHGRLVFQRLRALAASSPAVELRYDDVAPASHQVQAECATILEP